MTKVFLDYTQKELDDAYDQAVYAANREQLLARLAATSELVRKRIGEPEILAYGAAAIEKLHLYRARKPGPAPVNVFIHGGAWRAGSASAYAFPAEMFVHAGADFVAVDFYNVLETKGDLLPMSDQVKRAIAWVFKHAKDIGADQHRVFVSGTSSGAHLAGCAATTNWQKDFGIPLDAIKGYTLCSGMYDLRGPRLSKRSAYVSFTDEVEQALSPQRHIERIVAPITLVYGSLETPEFQRQARDFATALEQAEKPFQLIRAEGYNHFEIAETLATPYGPLGRAVLEQMRLSGL
ncbi:MAG: alpha/beta hydrolase [Betaproteobacteria bacterium]